MKAFDLKNILIHTTCVVLPIMNSFSAKHFLSVYPGNFAVCFVCGSLLGLTNKYSAVQILTAARPGLCN